MGEPVSSEIEQLIEVIKSQKTSHDNFQDDIKLILEAHTSDDDHRFVKTLREREKRRQEMWEKVQGSFIFWLVVSATSGISYAVWDYLKAHLK